MKVKMLTSLSGGFTVSTGDVVDFEDAAEAKRLIDAEYAEAADPKAKVSLTVAIAAPAEDDTPPAAPPAEAEGA